MDEPPSARDRAVDAASLPPHISQNITDIVELYQAETAALGGAQRRLEHFGLLIAQPLYFIGLFVLVGAWVVFNLDAPQLGLQAFDPPPFAWLQAFMTFVALVTATVVLIGQRRQTNLSEQRAHLDLQINLLTEQKVTRVIHMLEELRQDLPVAPQRSDAHTSALKEGINAAQVVSVLKQTELGSEGGKSPAPPDGQ